MIVERQLSLARRLAVLWILLPLGVLALPLWDWPVPDWTLLTVAVGAYAAAFWIGSKLASAALRPNAPALDLAVATGGLGRAAGMLIPLMLMLAILANIATIGSRAGAFNPFACANIFACSREAYQSYYETAGQSGSLVEYFRGLVSPLIYGALGLSIWNLVLRRGRQHFWLYIGVILTEVMLALATGTSRNIANFILFGALVRVIGLGLAPAEERGRTLLKLLPWILLMLLFFGYFAVTQLNREGLVAAVGIMPFGGTTIEALSYKTQSGSFVLKGLESVARYVSIGYFTFSYSFEMDAAQTFPFGNSLILARRAEWALGDASYAFMSIPAQIESAYGISRTQSWASLFSWLVSDIGYVGTFFFMLVAGAWSNFALALALTRAEALSKLPLFLAFLFILYAPANNQLGQGLETLTGAAFATVWLIMRIPALMGARSLPAFAHPRLSTAA